MMNKTVLNDNLADRDSLLKPHQLTLIKNNPFARLIVPSQAGALPVTAQLPLLLDEQQQCLYGHLARNNPAMAAITSQSQVLALFDGGHQYISPRWHQEQKVPTWNYASLELVCKPVMLTDAEDKLHQVIEMSRFFDPRWPVAEILAPQFSKQLQQMLNAICVFRLDICSGGGRFKLGQRKSSNYHSTIAVFMKKQGNEQLALWQAQPPQEY
ncbi:FMN-binding negative transcriptional regulator [Thalassomonas actiniarum]|uniref:FMN-binding negative transcriptional regulator n=1 Tax=Thalassomonas actiniarum TaxID=485447 RepID=A0AAF0C3A3_9GAMM|nr:FMN-binding negative transcriptional regulator [Thalassomonas actiniarum]WDD99367.1 FMN-binding negative transcriptional regulator [Thalassomonas actiniarum]